MTGVLFIVGASRSGSTLLERLLNELPGVMSVGELQRVWRRGFVENQLCSCGQPFHDCPFWGEVRQRLQADGRRADAGAVDALSRRAFKTGLRPLAPADEAILTHWSRLFGPSPMLPAPAGWWIRQRIRSMRRSLRTCRAFRPATCT